MSIRAMFVGNAPAQAAGAAAAKIIAKEATDRAEQELARAMLGDELPPPAEAPREKPAAETAQRRPSH